MVSLTALEFIAVNMRVLHANWVSLQVVGTCTTLMSNLRSILENSPDVASTLIWEVAVQIYTGWSSSLTLFIVSAV